MLALFRIIEATSGSILIDGVDIANLPLNLLRSSIAIIPQDPVLFSGTVRFNLDPFNESTDAQIWHALQQSNLSSAIERLELKLESPVAENGENFSVGQKCQICLARAMLRNAKVLIIDEGTANVDMETDSIIQNNLRNFFNCTILTIAHRLNTIIDYDRVIVMEDGRISEFDTPANLLNNCNSLLGKLIAETGTHSANLLTQQAQAKQHIRHNSWSSASHINPNLLGSLNPLASEVLFNELETSQVNFFAIEEQEVDSPHYSRISLE
jgi:ABC-type multidrug transport system fused ATPase/permease subunit